MKNRLAFRRVVFLGQRAMLLWLALLLVACGSPGNLQATAASTAGAGPSPSAAAATDPVLASATSAPPSAPTAAPEPLSSVTAVAGATPEATASPTAPPEPTDLPLILDAQELATSLYAAPDPESRYEALLQVMHALNVGVYEPTGKAILRGAEQGPDDFYLYDFELRALAAALERGTMRDATYLSDRLARFGVLETDGSPLEPETLRQGLLAAAQDSAAAPDGPTTLPYRLVRELGLLHTAPYDLLQDVTLEELQLDALQAFLVEADTLVPVARELAGLAGTPGAKLAKLPSRTAGSHAGLRQGPCDDMVGVSSISPWAKWLLGKLPWATIALLTMDAIHGGVLAYSVDVKAVSGAQSTHYGHEAPGDEMRFEIKVEMLDDYGDFLVSCGALAGYQIPAKGGIPGIGIVWFEGELERHGTLSYEPSSKKTGDDGVAALVFKPKDESRPNQGPQVEDKGIVEALATYQSAFGNVPGSIAQYLTPKSDVIAWTVARHVNLTLQIETVGTIEMGEGGSWNLGVEGNKVTIPLETTADGLEGSGSKTFRFVLNAPECSGDSTWGTEFTVKATGLDPLDISVWTPFMPRFNIQCEGGGSGSGPQQSVPAVRPATFTLPARDGASTVIGAYWKFTLLEQ